MSDRSSCDDDDDDDDDDDTICNTFSHFALIVFSQ